MAQTQAHMKGVGRWRWKQLGICKCFQSKQIPFPLLCVNNALFLEELHFWGNRLICSSLSQVDKFSGDGSYSCISTIYRILPIVRHSREKFQTLIYLNLYPTPSIITCANKINNLKHTCNIKDTIFLFTFPKR